MQNTELYEKTSYGVISQDSNYFWTQDCFDSLLVDIDGLILKLTGEVWVKLDATNTADPRMMALRLHGDRLELPPGETAGTLRQRNWAHTTVRLKLEDKTIVTLCPTLYGLRIVTHIPPVAAYSIGGRIFMYVAGYWLEG